MRPMRKNLKNEKITFNNYFFIEPCSRANRRKIKTNSFLMLTFVGGIGLAFLPINVEKFCYCCENDETYIGRDTMEASLFVPCRWRKLVLRASQVASMP